MNTKVVWSGVLMVLAVISGIGLTLKGRPLGALPANVHKLISVAFVVLTFLVVKAHLHSGGGPGWFTAGWVVAGVCLVILFASGAFLIQPEPFNRMVLLVVHTSAAVIGVISVAAVLWAAR